MDMVHIPCNYGHGAHTMQVWTWCTYRGIMDMVHIPCNYGHGAHTVQLWTWCTYRAIMKIININYENPLTPWHQRQLQSTHSVMIRKVSTA